MNPPIHLVLGTGDWLSLFGHYLMLSLMSIGGAISTTSEMHRFLVEQHGWLTQAQFNESVAIAQAAPGPNVLFVALMGWNVGLNAGSYAAAYLGVFVTMVGIMLPSTTLTYVAAQWGYRNRDLRGVRAFKQGMVPIVIALLFSTGMILGGANHNPGTDWPLWTLSIVAGLIIWRTRIHLLWLLAAGAVLGWFQLV
ncbi:MULTISPECIES: chromate transporter [unclassified Janthinobacterium]|uniref:chromate transporter n=1 Tax=unclassified Janthinobacterium TaxID=2610881 RepID=UPI0016077AC3|nr:MULTISPECIES: chromate transporter [unclassified Janthinobacterium]MBB5368894.1 chromate transporter [Janthinobacterium sp. K2C7]MBB5381570.1 chromate transporter [Janthinobacterium sp. K2Li3]MBB5387276.1 chromate transporter [Janthinobacterium sp. K2E3]